MANSVHFFGSRSSCSPLKIFAVLVGIKTVELEIIFSGRVSSGRYAIFVYSKMILWLKNRFGIMFVDFAT